MKMLKDTRPSALACVIALALGGCVAPLPSETASSGDEIIMAGRAVSVDTLVVTWKNVGGLDAYRTARLDGSGTPASYGARRAADGSTFAAGDFDALRAVVDQIVLHYDGTGNSRECFEHLAERQLSAHFLVDVDGTIYQTLDLQERAYHATVANNRSIGIEIANIGAFPSDEAQKSEPVARPEPVERPEGREGVPLADQVRGTVHGIELTQSDFTPEQYLALARLIDALCRTFPLIERRVPRDEAGAVVMSKLSDDDLENFRGILGHFHIQENKVDPGPAFQWELIFPR